ATNFAYGFCPMPTRSQRPINNNRPLVHDQRAGARYLRFQGAERISGESGLTAVDVTSSFVSFVFVSLRRIDPSSNDRGKRVLETMTKGVWFCLCEGGISLEGVGKLVVSIPRQSRGEFAAKSGNGVG